MRRRESPRDPEWLAHVLTCTDRLLRDHAHCEKKAAATALSLVQRYPEHPRLVREMVALAVEELDHLQAVHEVLVARGSALGPDEGDPYARALVGQVKGTPAQRLVDRLLVSALIEARSFERLRLLTKHHPDEELVALWGGMAKAEARHADLFVQLARELSGDEALVDRRLAELDAFERELVDEGPIRCAMH